LRSVIKYTVDTFLNLYSKNTYRHILFSFFSCVILSFGHVTTVSSSILQTKPVFEGVTETGNRLHDYRHESQKPNVILIVADDMGIGDISALNGGLSKTPVIDELIEKSVYFNQAYASSPVCGPSRASLLTGRHPHKTGVVSLSQVRYPELTSLNLNETTLADLFEHNGYRTGMVGKWHLGMEEEYLPLNRGFEESVSFLGGPDVPDDYFNFRLNVQGEYQSVEGDYLTDRLTDEAIKYVRKHHEEPFFLHLAHYAPHRPLSAPEEMIKPYEEAGLDRNTAIIYAMVEIMDQGIGRLIDELKELQIDQRTVVIFTSDNGPDPLTGSRFNSNLRGNKYTVYDGGIRVPFLVYWSGVLEPGKIDEIIHFTDVYPSLMELAELDNPSENYPDGGSFAPLLLNKNDNNRLPTYQYWQWNRGVPDFTHNTAIRDGKWKLVLPYVTHRVTTGPSEEKAKLYNLETDPDEQHDLSDEYFMRYEIMRTELRKWAKKMEYEWVKQLK